MEEVRVIININQSILTSLTSLTSFCTLACIGQKFSAWHNKFLNSLSICYVFRGKRGKEVRVDLLMAIFLLPLIWARGKGRATDTDRLLPLPGGKV
jgi:hypothetical protein